MTTTTTSVTQLGYLVFEVSDLPAWERFATGVLGLTVGTRRDDGALALRLDSHAQRFLLLPGEADDVAAIGWEVADATALAAVRAQIEATGVSVTEGTAELAASRQVAGLISLTDPGGVPAEIYFGPERAAEPFRSPVVEGGFVAAGLGLGHCVVSARDQDESLAFYRDALGFRLSDRITCEYYGHPVDIVFLHVNARHHTVAIGQRQPKRIHHFLVEAASVDAVGLAFDRALRARVPIMQTLGRHPNDRMFSFYAQTPSGFLFEFGHGGVLIEDEDAWEPVIHDRVSDWGHHPPAVLAPPKPRPKAP